jgi:hypothetical protein
MKSCGQCKEANYSGGQQQYADAKKQAVETLCYVFCRHENVRDHVDKSRAFECEYYEKKEVVDEPTE